MSCRQNSIAHVVESARNTQHLWVSRRRRQLPRVNMFCILRTLTRQFSSLNGLVSKQKSSWWTIQHESTKDRETLHILPPALDRSSTKSVVRWLPNQKSSSIPVGQDSASQKNNLLWALVSKSVDIVLWSSSSCIHSRCKRRTIYPAKLGEVSDDHHVGSITL